MSVEIEVTGDAEVMANLSRLAARFPDAIRGALKLEAELIATDAKKRTPVRDGLLKNSIEAEEPTGRGVDTEVRIVAGGPAATYARV